MKYLLSVFSIIIILLVSNLFLYSQTDLKPGDIAVVGMNANANCPLYGFPTGDDLVQIVFLVEIEPGTEIKLTDNAYQRLATNPDKWGNNEGIVRLSYNGPARIPAGTIVEFRWQTEFEALYPAEYSDWSFTKVDSSNMQFFNIAITGDQLYILQGEKWDNGNSSSHDATYTGTVLYAHNTTSEWIDFANSNSASGLHPSIDPCCNFKTNEGVEAYSSYTGPSSPTTKENWMVRITNALNWTDWGSCDNYQGADVSIEIIEFEFNGLPEKMCDIEGVFSLPLVHSGISGSWSGPGINNGYLFDPSGLSGQITIVFTPENDTLDSIPYDISVNPSPFSYFEFSETSPGTFAFNNLSEDADEFQWDFGDGNFSEDHHPIHTYDETGLYQVTLISFNTCGNDTFRIEVNYIGVSVVEATAPNILIYPNPTDGILNMHIDYYPQGMRYQLINSMGQLVDSELLHYQGDLKLNLSEFSPGVYNLVLFSDYWVSTYQIVLLE